MKFNIEPIKTKQFKKPLPFIIISFYYSNKPNIKASLKPIKPQHMYSSESQNTLNLQYTLHPIISQLNMQLLHQSPHNPYQFIKQWVNRKIKQLYEHEDEDDEQADEDVDTIKKKIIFNDKLSQFNEPKTSALIGQSHRNSVPQIKRRTAVFFYHQQAERAHNYIEKSQQTKSRIMISLKNDIFFKDMSWEKISQFVQMGDVFQTEQEDEIIHPIDEPFTEFIIVVSGQIMRQNRQGDIVNTYYTGQCLCHQSFLHPSKSKYHYICHQPKTLLFRLSGSQISNCIQSMAHENFLFYQKVLMNKEEFNYLDDQEKDKLISCFRVRREVMQGEVVFRGEDGTEIEKRIYVVVKGEFSKCKKNLSNQLMPFKTLREGDFFGEENLHAFTNIDYTVICLQDNSEIAYLQKSSFQQSVDSYQRIVQRAKMQVKYVASKSDY